MAGNLRDFDKDSLGGSPLVVLGDSMGHFCCLRLSCNQGPLDLWDIYTLLGRPEILRNKKNRPLVLPREVREDRAHGIILKLSIPKNIGKTEFLLKTIIKIFKLNNLSYLAKIVMDNPGVQ